MPFRLSTEGTSLCRGRPVLYGGAVKPFVTGRQSEFTPEKAQRPIRALGFQKAGSQHSTAAATFLNLSVETLSLYQHPLCQPVFINRLDFEQGGHRGQHIETVLGSIHSRLQLAGLSWTCSEATWSLRPFSHKLQHHLHPILQPLCRAQILKGAKPNVKKGFKDPFKKDQLSRPCQIPSRTF